VCFKHLQLLPRENPTELEHHEMSISDKARDARPIADETGNSGDVALAGALEATEAAAAREQLTDFDEEPDLSGIPSPENAGLPSHIRLSEN
jgi:hypothetical protein